jgi:tRNA pseudouridine(38-40) synthase
MRLVVAYDGAAFSGFARQRARRTVQGELEAALGRLAKGPVVTVGAGRTDAGVHARGQVVHADVPAGLDPDRVRRALNGGLGPAIVVREAAWAPAGFDARLSARRRTYVYRIDDSGEPDPLLRGFVLAWPRPLDLDRMRKAWSRCAWSPTPSAGRWSAGSSATCSWWATAAATRPARPTSWPPPTAPGPATLPPPTAWSSNR